MDNIFTLSATPSKNGLTIKGVANSLQRSRDGVKINAESAEKVVGQSVPLLESHDWGGMPVGRASITKISEEGMEFDGKIFQSAPDYDLLKENISAGTLSVSVGFIAGAINADNEATDIDLLELSLTPTPADKHASVTLQSIYLKKSEVDINKKKEVENMDKDSKKKITEAEGDPASSDTSASDSSDSSSELTLQDLADQIAAIASDVSDIKKMVSDASSSDNSDSSDDDAKAAADAATQALKSEAMAIVKEGISGTTYSKLYHLFK